MNASTEYPQETRERLYAIALAAEEQSKQLYEMVRLGGRHIPTESLEQAHVLAKVSSLVIDRWATIEGFKPSTTTPKEYIAQLNAEATSLRDIITQIDDIIPTTIPETH